MTEPDQFPKHSPLAQSITRDGKTVSVEIYEDGEGGWLLEVVDEYVREEKEVVLNSGEMLIAWIYIYNRPTGALEEISSGDFLRVNDI